MAGPRPWLATTQLTVNWPLGERIGRDRDRSRRQVRQVNVRHGKRGGAGIEAGGRGSESDSLRPGLFVIQDAGHSEGRAGLVEREQRRWPAARQCRMVRKLRFTVRALVARVLRVTVAVVLLPLEIVELARINESVAPLMSRICKLGARLAVGQGDPVRSQGLGEQRGRLRAGRQIVVANVEVEVHRSCARRNGHHRPESSRANCPAPSAGCSERWTKPRGCLPLLGPPALPAPLLTVEFCSVRLNCSEFRFST